MCLRIAMMKFQMMLIRRSKREQCALIAKDGKKNERNDEVKKKIPICLQYFSVLQPKNTQKKKDHDEFHSSVIFSSMKLTAKWRRTFSRQISDNHFCLFRTFSHIVVYFFPVLSLSSISIEVNPICSN